MKNFYLLLFCFGFLVFTHAQPNLNLTATPTASTSSSGSYGPANWTDGIKNGSTFGWVGTAPSMTMPSYMEFTWATPQTFDSIVIYNVSSNFSPPAGNGVVFSGTADLEYHNGTQWVNIMSFSGQGTYSSSYSLSFSPVTTTQFRIVNINTGTNPSNHNPGFDEVEVYLSPLPPSVVDAELTSVDTALSIVNEELTISALVTNVGNQVIDTVELSYQNTNAANAVSESFYVMLAPAADTLLTFTQSLDLDTLPSPLSNEDLCIWTKVSQDMSNNNDTICLSLAPLSVEENTLMGISVYPNPASGKFMVQSNSPVKSIAIYRTDGVLVFEKEIDSTRAEVEAPLASGIYVVVLKTEAKTEVVRLAITKE